MLMVLAIAGLLVLLTAVVAAVLIWSVLYLDLLRNHAGAALAQPSSTQSGPTDSRPAPAPVTTRTS